MNSFLFCPLQENRPVFRERIKTLMQPGQRNNRPLPPELGFAENKVEALGVKIDIGNPQHFVALVKRGRTAKFMEDLGGDVLASDPVKSLSGDFYGFPLFDFYAKFLSQFTFDNIDHGSLNISNRLEDDFASLPVQSILL